MVDRSVATIAKWYYGKGVTTVQQAIAYGKRTNKTKNSMGCVIEHIKIRRNKMKRKKLKDAAALSFVGAVVVVCVLLFLSEVGNSAVILW